MVIETIRERYLVIGYLEQDQQKEVCIGENTVDHSRILIIRIRDPQLISAAAPFLYEQVTSEAFTDFQDCFVSGETLLLVFSGCEGEALTAKLEREYHGLEERLEMVKKLLERIILLDLPDYFAASCLQPDNIFVKRSLDISFRYEITGIEQSRFSTIRDVQAQLAKVLKLVFDAELKKAVLGPMADLIADLAVREYADYLELYRRFLQVRKELLALPPEQLDTPATFWFRLWGRVRKVFKPLRRMVAVLALAAGLLYLLWTFERLSRPAVSQQVIDQIGTLKIR